MPDVIYLRKSRADMELESRSEVDVLARHEAELRRNAARLGRTITAVYREVVSGDTIADRPQMQRLLYEVETGKWDAVHVVETSRLARGDTIDQGIVARAFQLSGTLIVTPTKIVDPNNEYDEDYFEFDLFMARREYKAITRRQQRGRMASIREGKWVANKAPYGYDRVKLTGEKGWTLQPNADAPTVREIFVWYTREGLGVSRIVRRLNDMGILSPSGKDWTNAVVRAVLANPAYKGMIAWGRRAGVKSVSNGAVVRSRPRAAEYSLLPGRHEPLVSEADFAAAQDLLSHNPSRPGPKEAAMKNPLAGLVYCSKCGRAMVRRPYGGNYPDSLICPYTSCDTVGSRLETVEAAVLESLRRWLADLYAGKRPEETDEAAELARADRQIAAVKKELEDLQKQLSRIYDLTEQGVYTSDDFINRSKENAARREAAEQRLVELSDRKKQLHAVIVARDQLAPDLHHVLDAYPMATVEEKNALLKTVLSRVIYSKSTRERWSTGSDLRLDLIPRISFGSH